MPSIRCRRFSASVDFLRGLFWGFGNSIARREELEYLGGRIEDTSPGLRQSRRNGSMEAWGLSMGSGRD